MKMRRISALKNSSECFDINKGGTAGFRSLGDWASVSILLFLQIRRQLWQKRKW